MSTFLRDDATFAAIAAGDTSGLLVAANNLSDVANAATARTNLGVAYGLQTIWVPSAAMKGRITNGATGPNNTETAVNFVNILGLDFAAGSDQFAQFITILPKSWDVGTLTARFVRFQPVGAATGTFIFGIQAVQIGASTAADQAFGTGQEVTTNAPGAGNVVSSALTAAMTIAQGAISGLSADRPIVFQVYRAGSRDTCASSTRLVGVELLYNTNANNDT